MPAVAHSKPTGCKAQESPAKLSKWQKVEKAAKAVKKTPKIEKTIGSRKEQQKNRISSQK